MQEKEKNVSTCQFLSVFGTKITGAEFYNPEDDTTDQRAPVNDPQALYEQFVVPEDIMDELESETIDDFDNDDEFYPYEDRTDYGVDIADAARLDLKKSKERLLNSKKKKKEAPEEEVEVNPDVDE